MANVPARAFLKMSPIQLLHTATLAVLLPSVLFCTAEPTVTAGKKSLPLPGEAFQLDGHDAFVITPPGAKAGIPWVWYAPTLRGLPGGAEVWMFEQFLAAGIAVAGIDVGESYGSPEGREIYSRFYENPILFRKPKKCRIF